MISLSIIHKKIIFLTFCPGKFEFSWFGALSFQVENTCIGGIRMVLLNFKMRLPTGHLGTFIFLNPHTYTRYYSTGWSDWPQLSKDIGLFVKKQRQRRQCLEPRELYELPLGTSVPNNYNRWKTTSSKIQDYKGLKTVQEWRFGLSSARSLTEGKANVE